MISKVDDENRVPLEETKNPGGKFEIPYVYFLHRAKVNKSNVREKIK